MGDQVDAGQRLLRQNAPDALPGVKHQHGVDRFSPNGIKDFDFSMVLGRQDFPVGIKIGKQGDVSFDLRQNFRHPGGGVLSGRQLLAAEQIRHLLFPRVVYGQSQQKNQKDNNETGQPDAQTERLTQKSV